MFRSAIKILLSLIVLPSIITAQIITTVAGTAPGGYKGNGEIATTARLYHPIGVAVDNQNNIFITDAENNVIRKIDAAGIITTVAGNGIDGYSGDGGSATSACLDYPYGIAIDNSGNIFVADYNNHVVRKITSLGIISTIAGTGVAGYSGDGNNATAATLNHPTGIAIDNQGNIFISDYNNNVVRKVDVTGIITTVAGTGVGGYSGDGGLATTATFRKPISIDIDVNQNLYVADYGNYAIRKVEIQSGVITTIAGNGTSGFYPGDSIAGSARLSCPNAVKVDNAGNIIIADDYNYYSVNGIKANRIRKITPAGIITTIAGNGLQGYTGDGGLADSATFHKPLGLAVDAVGNIFIADHYNNVIRKISTSGIISTVVGSGYGYAGGGGFSGDGGLAINAHMTDPKSIAFDTSGNYYIADFITDRIRKVDVNGIITTIAGNGENGSFADGILAVDARFDGLQSITIDKHGNLYTSERFYDRVRKINTSGIITTIAGSASSGFSGDGGPAVAAKLYCPDGMVTDNFGNLFIADWVNSRIRKIDANGIITTVAGNGQFGYTGDGGQAKNASLNHPIDVCLDAIGNLYIADEFNNVIRKVDPAGIISTIAGDGSPGYNGDGGLAIDARLNNPTSIRCDQKGNLYLADVGNATIRKIDTFGIITTVVGIATSGFWGDGIAPDSAKLGKPWRIAINDSGDLFIADGINHCVRKVNFATFNFVPIDTSNNNNNNNSNKILPDVIVYPNPNNGAFTINVPKEDYLISLDIIDGIGHIVYSDMNSFGASGDVKVDLSKYLVSGCYFVRIKLATKNLTYTLTVVE